MRRILNRIVRAPEGDYRRVFHDFAEGLGSVIVARGGVVRVRAVG